MHEIGRAHGWPHPSIRCVLLPRGLHSHALREKTSHEELLPVRRFVR